MWRTTVIMVLALVAMGCAQRPTPTPPFVVCPVPHPMSSESMTIDYVEEHLGYVLIPDCLPEGYSQSRIYLSGPSRSMTGTIGSREDCYVGYLYSHPVRGALMVTYPIPYSFSADNVVRGYDMKLPDGVRSDLSVRGEQAYLLEGSWSDPTIVTMTHPEFEFDPSAARWDRKKSRSLYFKVSVNPGKSVGVWIDSLKGSRNVPEDTDELIRIAESFSVSH